MQKIIIQVSENVRIQNLIKDLKHLDYISSVKLQKSDLLVSDSEIKGKHSVDEYVTQGKPMSLDTFRERIKTAEKEDEHGKSIADEELIIVF